MKKGGRSGLERRPSSCPEVSLYVVQRRMFVLIDILSALKDGDSLLSPYAF